eukprot:3870462-Rhodomonas_salina.1
MILASCAFDSESWCGRRCNIRTGKQHHDTSANTEIKTATTQASQPGPSTTALTTALSTSTLTPSSPSHRADSAVGFDPSTVQNACSDG